MNAKEILKKFLPPIMIDLVRLIRARKVESKPLRNVLDRESDSAQSPLDAEEMGYTSYHSYADPLYSPWLTDRKFAALYARVSSDVKAGTTYKDGRYVLCCLAKQALLQDGDIIECGVHLGQSSHLLAYVIDEIDASRRLYALDSFEGFPQPSELDVDVQTGKQFFTAGAFNNVNLKALTRVLKSHQCEVNIIKGWIPQTFDGLQDKRFCLAHIDVDLYQSVLDSLDFVYERIVTGGFIVLDDYGFPMCPGARAAVDEFFADKPETPLPLPTGQAVVFKV